MLTVHRTRRLSAYTLLLVGALLLGSFATNSSTSAQEGAAAYWRYVRTIEADQLGVERPAGLAYSPQANAFLIVEARASRIVMLTPTEGPAGTLEVGTTLKDPLNLAFDGKANRLLAFDPATQELVEIKAKSSGVPDPASLGRFDARALGLQNPRGLTVDPASGRLYLLDSGAQRIVRVDPAPDQSLDIAAALKDGRVSSIDLKPAGLVNARGLALNPANGHLYLLSPAKQALYELTQTGQVVATRDLSNSDDFKLVDPQGMLFAPSGDQTDDPSQMSLYLADSGLPELTTTSENINAIPTPDTQSTGQIVELSLLAPAALPPGTTLLPTTLVYIIDTSNAAWNPSAPDTAGVDYWPLTGRLLISDSEVEEMPPYWAGKNVFQSTTSGTLVSTCSTTAYSNEPTGVAINPNNNHIFFSDDSGSNDKVFEVGLGSDGVYCTADDTVTINNVGGLYGITDAEDVAYGNNTLYVAGGIDAEVYRIPLGANGVLGGGDDGAMTRFDTATLGFNALEGLGYNGNSGTLLLVSPQNADKYLGETTTTGTLLNAYDLAYAGLTHREDVTYAPGSQNPAIKNMYVSDRGVDNNSNPNENDGQVWEINIGPGAPTPTPTPSNTPGPSPTPTDTPIPTDTPTPSPTPPVSDLIFADGFESGSFSAWSANKTDGGDLSVSAAAALVGSNGLQAVIDDTITIYVTNDTPNAEPRYRVRFYFDPNSIPMASGNAHFVFSGLAGTSTAVLRVEFRLSSGSYQIRGRLLNDGSTWMSTSWFTISDAPHPIELDWQAATAAGTNDGGLTLWIDGVQQASLTGIDNDTWRIDRARLGSVSGIDSGTLGTYYFDAFESRRQTYIGP